MTDYIPYTPDEYAPEAPATALHFQRWFENCVAMFEGAPNAPRLMLGALPELAPGTGIRCRGLTNSTGSNVYVTACGFMFLQRGTARFTCDHRTSSGTWSADVALVRTRAGTVSTLQTWNTNSATNVFRSADLAVKPGDLFEFRHRTNSTVAQSIIENPCIRTSGADIWPTPGGNMWVEALSV